MIWWIVIGVLAWAILLALIFSMLRMAALSDHRDEAALPASHLHRKEVEALEEAPEAWQERAGPPRSQPAMISRSPAAPETVVEERTGGDPRLAAAPPERPTTADRPRTGSASSDQRARNRTRSASPQARIWAVGVIGLTAYAVQVSLPLGGRDATALLVAATVLPASATCVAAARRRRAERFGWMVAAAAVICYGASIAAYVLEPSAASHFPSHADVGLFAFYPLMLLSLVLLVQARLGRLRPALWLDALMGAFAVAALGAVALRRWLAEDPSGVAFGQFAYAEGDLLFLGFLAATMVFVGRRPSPLLLMLAAGTGLLTAGDLAYVARVVPESAPPGIFEQICWPAGLLVLSGAGWQPSVDRRATVRIDWRDLAMPVLAACVCLPIALLSDQRTDPLAVVFSGGGLALVLARLSASLLENVGLLRGEARAAQQAVVAALGRRALDGGELEPLVAEATSAIGELLGADLCGIVEIHERDGDHLRTAGDGWPSEVADSARVHVEERTLIGHLLRCRAPVCFEQLDREQRFESPALAASGVTSGAAALISAGGRPLGALGAFSRHRQRFSPDDLHFLEAIANVLAQAIERKSTEDELTRRALHDPLTGLPNRTLLLDRIEQMLSRRSNNVGLVFLDLDGFKEVNDSLGHAAGDRLLQVVAERLRHSLRPADTAARLGGDEFAIACELPAGAEPSFIAERTSRALEPPVLLDGEERVVRASVGMAVAHSGDMAPEDLLRDADAAMYAAKARGGMSPVLFADDMRNDAARQRRLQHDLERALEAGQLSVVYQPVVRLRDGTVVGAEALLRWQHPHHGMIAPEVFVPIAERTGLIVPIGRWVLEEACRRAAPWRAEKPFSIAVNVSPRQLADPQLPNVVAHVLETTGTAPEQLCLEITESVLIDCASPVAAALAQVKALGPRLALDDFGTGYASLRYLQRFPIDVIKLDRSFVADLPSAGSSHAIVTSTIALVQALELTLVAEGVQTQAQSEYLAALGCQQAQGYHFGPPVSPAAMSRLLEEQPLRGFDPPGQPVPRSRFRR